MRPGPFLDVPVVVGAHHRRRLLTVGGVHEQLAAEPRKRRKAQRTQHAVGVHVAHPVTDVVAAGPDLLDTRGFTAELLAWAPGHRVEGGVEDLLAAVAPGHCAVVATDEARCVGGVLLRHTTLEHVGGLDHVVVDAHQDHVVDVHLFSS